MALGGCAHEHASAIVHSSKSFDQLGFPESVHQPGGVRILGNHPGSNGLRADPVRSGRGDDAQGVVLRIGNAVLLEELIELMSEQCMGSAQIEVGLLFRELEGLGLADLFAQVSWGD